MIFTPQVVQTLALQVAIPILGLGFGVLALRVAPNPGAEERTVAWFMAGVTFTLDGVIALAHALAAVAAMFVPSTAFFRAFVALTPPANDARNLLVLGFAAGLVWVLLLRGVAPSRRTIVTAAFLLTVAGFTAGFAEPPLEPERFGTHFSLMSLAGAVTAVLLFATLYRAMVRGTIDWLLWIALALYAIYEALSSNIQTILAWAGFGGGWAPPVRSMMWAGVVAASAMLACSVRRLALARAGEEAPGLLERLRG